MVLEKIKRKPFGVVAHRGGIEKYPENTVAAISYAVELGVDVVEVDVRPTKDGELILLHDPDFERVAGVKARPEELTMEEIGKIKIDAQPVATLEEALRVIGGKCALFVEIKEPKTTQKAIEIIQKAGAGEWAAIISFWEEAVIGAKEASLAAGLVYSRPPGKIKEAKEIGADFVLPKYTIATQKANRFAHALGLPVVVWTVNDAQKAQEMVERGADAIATDYPSVLLKMRDSQEF
jgi:glycerophosphoryl diester phosphodiesterase